MAHASSWDSGRRQLHIGVPGRDLFSRVVSHRAGQGTGGTVCTVPNSRTSTRILSLYHQPWIKNAAFPLSPPIIPVKVVLFASVAKRQVENAQLTCFHVRSHHVAGIPTLPRQRTPPSSDAGACTLSPSIAQQLPGTPKHGPSEARG